MSQIDVPGLRAAPPRRPRKRSDGLYVRSLGPREGEALRLIERRPGITVAELAESMGISMSRAWQYVARLEASRIRRELWHADSKRQQD